ncbi:connector enhancer of kinase suppressor of ras 1 isoform X1 [Athene cunicularia]|uniref:connector enhancer of kinase suppressor of ras 1 isoform X1 n=1 Tax=Athene cunicularia TaxID=194338 RepID=UPI000EF6F814|nr:connector enhancer of kinase suppressor of ras 1 isoform X1 [Athene cunicularia]
MRCLKQGGVSLIGRQRFLTQEQCRKSFIRRNKNPHINEKVHAVRALQSTLKALPLGRRSWWSCRLWSSCSATLRSPRRSSGAGRKSTRSCTRTCGSGGAGSRARMAMGGSGMSTAPPKRQLSPDTPQGPLA